MDEYNPSIHLKKKEGVWCGNKSLFHEQVLTDKIEECTCEYCKRAYFNNVRRIENLNKMRARLGWRPLEQ